MQKSRAVVFLEPRSVVVGEVDLPARTPTDVLIEIEHTAISVGTERWCLTDSLSRSNFHGIGITRAVIV